MTSKIAVSAIALVAVMRRRFDPTNIASVVRFCTGAIPVVLALFLLAGCSGSDEARAELDYYRSQVDGYQGALAEARAELDNYRYQVDGYQQALAEARAQSDANYQQILAYEQALAEARAQSETRYEEGFAGGLALGRTQNTQVSYDQGYAQGLLQGRADGLNGLTTTNADANVGSEYKAVALELAVATTPEGTTDSAPTPSATPTDVLRSQTVTVTLTSRLYSDYYLEQLTDVLVAGEPENLYHYEGDEDSKEVRQNTTVPEGLHCYDLHILWKNFDGLEDGDDSSGHLYVEGDEEFHLIRTNDNEWKLENPEEKSIAVFDWLREGETKRLVHIILPDQEDIIFTLDKGLPFDADDIRLPLTGALEYEIVTEVSTEASPKPVISESPAPLFLSAESGELYQIVRSGESIGLQPSSYCREAQGE